MSAHGEKTSRPWEPERYRQDAQSPTAKRPEGDQVFFLLDTVPQLVRLSALGSIDLPLARRYPYCLRLKHAQCKGNS